MVDIELWRCESRGKGEGCAAAECRRRRAASPGHPVWQQHRPCADGAGRYVCRRAGRTDLTGLRVAVERLRQAVVGIRDPRCGRGVRRTRCAVRACTGAFGRPLQVGAVVWRRRRLWTIRRQQSSRPSKPGWPRHRGEDPLHLRFHRCTQGGHQHASHVGDQPGATAPCMAVPRRRPARAAGLAALESHFRRQSQLRAGVAQRRHAVHRRKQAFRRPPPTCWRCRRTSTSMCRRGSTSSCRC